MIFGYFYVISGTSSAQIRRSRSESHSDAYDADDGEDLFIPRNIKNGKYINFFKLIKSYPNNTLKYIITLFERWIYLYRLVRR